MPTSTLLADLAIYDKQERLVVIAEIKTRTEKTIEWATQMRRNILAHGLIPTCQIFLLILPDKIYLWGNSGNFPEMLPPNFVIETAPFFAPYYERNHLNPKQLRESSFSLIVMSWINELINFGIPKDLPQPHKDFLLTSGLYPSIEGGRVSVDIRL